MPESQTTEQRKSICFGFLLAFLGGCSQQHSLRQTTTFTQANAKHGEYLAEIYACEECHTVRETDGIHLNRTLLFAGGELIPGFRGSFIYSPNVTVSSQYSARVLDDTIRGRVAYKYRMPTNLFNSMAADDMRDLIAYIKELRPVLNRPLPDDRLPPGYVVPSPNPPQPIPEHEPPVGTLERGKYLAAMLQCQDCHSPRDSNANYIPAQLFQGGGLQLPLPTGKMLIAPNITPDLKTGIGSWSDDDIVRVLHTGVTPDGRQLNPTMPSLSAYYNLTDQDARDVIRFLRSLTPVERSWPSVQEAQERQ